MIFYFELVFNTSRLILASSSFLISMMLEEILTDSLRLFISTADSIFFF